MAMADRYESHREATTDYLSAFRPVANRVRMIVFIDGRVVGFEILYRFGAFRGNHSKLVNSYVMDALESVGVSEIEIRKSVALGNHVRLGSGNQMLQMTVFAAENGKVAGPPRKMRRASVKRESQNKDDAACPLRGPTSGTGTTGSLEPNTMISLVGKPGPGIEMKAWNASVTGTEMNIRSGTGLVG